MRIALLTCEKQQERITYLPHSLHLRDLLLEPTMRLLLSPAGHSRGLALRLQRKLVRSFTYRNT